MTEAAMHMHHIMLAADDGMASARAGKRPPDRFVPTGGDPLSETMSYFRWLIATDRPYKRQTAAADLGVCGVTITERLTILRKRGLVQVQMRGRSSVVTLLETGAHTAAPEGCEVIDGVLYGRIDRVVRWLERNAWSTEDDVAKALGVEAQDVRWRLKHGATVGRLEVDRVSEPTRYAVWGTPIPRMPRLKGDRHAIAAVEQAAADALDPLRLVDGLGEPMSTVADCPDAALGRAMSHAMGHGPSGPAAEAEFQRVLARVDASWAMVKGARNTDAAVLEALRSSGPCTAGELARVMGRVPGAITGVLIRLHVRALVDCAPRDGSSIWSAR
jgi:predicted ArsR family transcriptional regulator